MTDTDDCPHCERPLRDSPDDCPMCDSTNTREHVESLEEYDDGLVVPWCEDCHHAWFRSVVA